MKRVVIILVISFFSTLLWSQTQPLDKPLKGYRFQHRIKGPVYKKSKVLELMIDEFGNYAVATFRGEKASFVYLIIYNLYTWDEKYKIKLDDNRCELYNSSFDEDGEFFYVNYDIYRNLFKKINLRTGAIEKVDCAATPKGCKKIEPQHYKVDGYTIGDNYYLHRDEKFENYIRVLVKKEMYIPKDSEMNGGFNGPMDVDPSKGGVLQVTPAQVRELKAGSSIEIDGIPIFFDANAIDASGNVIPYEPGDDDPYKIRLTQVDINKLEKRISFTYEKFVLKIDLDAWEKEQQGSN